MKRFGEFLSSVRKKKKISLDRASRDLVIQKNHLQALESEDWTSLPDPAFVKGYIKSYAQYLGINQEYLFALYRREFDESKYPKEVARKSEKRLFITPAKLLNTVFIAAVIAFVIYIIVQYSSIFSSPKLEIYSPRDNETTSVPAIEITGQTEKDATISVNGKFIPVNEKGNFTGEYMLTVGKNYIEVIASFRLSPKNKVTRTVRLIR